MNLRYKPPYPTAADDRLHWAERCMRVLSVHYFAPQLDLIFEPAGPVSIYAGNHEISRADSLGEALELGIKGLSDAELLLAMEGV